MNAAERWRDRMADATMRESLDKLFGIEHEGARWVFATNGHELVAEHSDRSAATWSGSAALLAGVLTPGELDCGEIATAMLLAWTGAAIYPHGNGCVACDGKGVFPHNCDCEHCDRDTDVCDVCGGIGVLRFPDERPGWLHGHLFDRNKIARVLDCLGAEQVRVRLKPMNESSIAYFDAPGRRGIVTGLQERSYRGVVNHPNAPKFAGEPVGAS